MKLNDVCHQLFNFAERVFSSHLKFHIKILLSQRNTFCVNQNQYFFIRSLKRNLFYQDGNIKYKQESSRSRYIQEFYHKLIFLSRKFTPENITDLTFALFTERLKNRQKIVRIQYHVQRTHYIEIIIALY